MYRLGPPELQAIERVIARGKPFRYFEPSECARFEADYSSTLGVRHVALCSSGTAALVAALAGLGIGPGDEVIVPAVTYMATATAVLAVGAIPWIVDVDESLTLDPAAFEAAIGPKTRAVIPVHMWGQCADLGAIVGIARAHDVIVVEDACQAVGGGVPGAMLGSVGRAGAFSFNYYKNISCGEGGAVCTDDDAAFECMRCAIDCAGYFWNGQPEGFRGFASNSSRASEFEGALLRAQLERLPTMIAAMRKNRAGVLNETRSRLTAAPSRNPDGDCGTHAVFQFDDRARAAEFAARAGGTVVSETGRHVYTRWTPVLEHRGAHHPALNPFTLRENAECRKDYRTEMCARSLDIASRSVLVAMHPDHTDEDLEGLVARCLAA